MLEREFERKFKKKVMQHGAVSYKLLSTTNGLPDRIVIKAGNVLFVELKNEKGRLTPLQGLRHAELKSMGLNPIVLKPADLQGFLDMLDAIPALPAGLTGGNDTDIDEFL